MKIRTVFPVVALLGLVAAGPALAQSGAPATGQFWPLAATTSASSARNLAVGDAYCRTYTNYHARDYCREVHGIPDNIN